MIFPFGLPSKYHTIQQLFQIKHNPPNKDQPTQMENLLLFATLGLLTLYLFLITGFVMGLYRAHPKDAHQRPFITIIVPAHNEVHNLPECLEALAAQSYPPDQLEIIVVDDRSTDHTADLIRQKMKQMPQLKLISVSTQTCLCPKKNALNIGIQASSGTLIFTTDADCQPQKHWVETMVTHFTPEVGMVMGYAPLQSKQGFFQSLLSLQSLVVGALAAGSSGMGFPLTCSGRNLAYRRRAFDDVNGFDPIGHIIGGDDVLLMCAIAKTPWKIRFNHAPNAAVLSAPHTDRQFDRQRRYQSKAIHYGIPTLILALAIYIFHFILFLYPVFAWIYPTLVWPFGGCLAIKMGADLTFLFLAAHRLRSPFPPVQALILEMVLLPYIVIFCALGIFAPFKWK